MKMWMVDLKVGEDEVRRYAIVFAPTITSVHNQMARHLEDDDIEDVFEIELDDPRWENLTLIGDLKEPERF